MDEVRTWSSYGRKQLRLCRKKVQIWEEWEKTMKKQYYFWVTDDYSGSTIIKFLPKMLETYFNSKLVLFLTIEYIQGLGRGRKWVVCIKDLQLATWTDKKDKNLPSYSVSIKNTLAIVFATKNYALMHLSVLLRIRAMKHATQLWLLPVFLVAVLYFCSCRLCSELCSGCISHPEDT